MSEQSNGGIPGDMPPDEGAAHAEAIAITLRNLVDYGPVKVSTRVPDIPGIEYQRPYPNDDIQTPIAYIGNTLLSVEVEEADVQVKVHGADEAEPYILNPSQIEKVFVDHPYGHFMPLQGRDMMIADLTNYHGLSVLRWPDHVIEHGWKERIDITNHPEHSGVTIVKAYAADIKDFSKPTEIPTLEEAKVKDRAPKTFLITRINDETYVVTSRLGHKATRPVTVRKPKEPRDGRLLHIEMLDMNKATSDQGLVDLHIKRYQELSGNTFRTPSWPMTPFEADEVFLYMVSD